CASSRRMTVSSTISTHTTPPAHHPTSTPPHQHTTPSRRASLRFPSSTPSVLLGRQVAEPVQRVADRLLAQHAQQLPPTGGQHFPGQWGHVGPLRGGSLPQPGHLPD